MKRNWTKEQKAVIEHRNGNLLVSAGAGAGKTAVLVERILGRILEEENPIDLDEFLVVTFTRASAAEMKERIGIALEEKLAKEMETDPDSPLVRRLMRQYALLPEAEISTIDSFCKSVVMEYFQKTDLDPSFRIADEGEFEVIKAELLESFLEKKFEEREETFLRLVEYFERGKAEGKLEELILDFLRISESFPDQKAWFSDEIFRLQGELFEENRMEAFLTFLKKRLLAVKAKNEKALELVRERGGAIQYEPALLSDEEKIENLLSVGDMRDFFDLFAELSFATLSRAKPKDRNGNPLEVNEVLKEKAKTIRDGYKEMLIKKIKERYFYEEAEELCREYEEIRNVLISLLKVSAEFGEKFMAEKRRRNLVDFSDLAHTALDLLLDKEGKPTAIAGEYRDVFAEIMIDEYQDSNRIQDLLLGAISREAIGEPNLFMVGDVKQSIYGFRQAEPKIFLEKYHRYSEEGPYRKISLSKNFRSGKEVIDTVNTVFRIVMREDIGGLCYDEKAALAVGREDFLKTETVRRTELLLFDEKSEEIEEEKGNDLSGKELEALMVGTRMRELRKEGWKYSDMTILLRSLSDWGEVFRATLSSMGIPAVCETSTGYFKAWEVQVILSYLTVIDNPIQDIPLVSVLLSPIGGFTEAELASIRMEVEDGGFWEALIKREDEKTRRFLSCLQRKRQEAVFMPVRDIIRLIYEESGFYEYVAGMKGGEVRIANLDMLLTKAAEFEMTSLFGLHSFIRYIEKLRKYEKDFGEAEVADSTEAVRIMSIHKSKGLEFPLVFVCGLAKGFNEKDATKTVVIHKEIGIATDYFRPETREEGKGFLKNFIADRIRLDNLSEEIRILYVAFTRAKEKLILTGMLKNASEHIEEVREAFGELTEEEGFAFVSDSGSFLDLVLPALLTGEGESIAPPRIFGWKELYRKEGEELFDRENFIKALQEKAESTYSSKEEREAYRKLQEEIHFKYPFEEAVIMKPSMTVTELKRLFLTEQEAEVAEFLKTEEKTKKGLLDGFTAYIPQFSEEEVSEEVEGARRGILSHKFLAGMDFEKDYTKEDILNQISKMEIEEKLKSFDLDCLYDFTKSTLAGRMKEADYRGELFRETPFTIGIKKAIGTDEETVVVQGMTDAWFFEEGEPVLVDYKTDRVFGKEGEELLKKRYRTQLAYYKEAIERITGKKVKETILYSLVLKKEIRMD